MNGDREAMTGDPKSELSERVEAVGRAEGPTNRGCK